jgi:hypothetical protein
VQGGSSVFIESSVEVRRTPSYGFRLLAPETTIDIQAAVPNYVYGNNNTAEIFQLDTNGSRIYYADLASLVAASAGNQWSRPGAAGAFAALPSATAASFSGIVLRA